jgi:asparaginyl-tRNA synthetase
VSGQLEAEIFAQSMSDVYTFGPTFRAENSNTSRHLAEFWMVEPEVAFCDLDDLAQLAEDFLRYIFAHVLETCPEDMAFFNRFYDKELITTLEDIANSDFERMTYTEAVAAIQASGESFDYPVQWGSTYSPSTSAISPSARWAGRSSSPTTPAASRRSICD